MGILRDKAKTMFTLLFLLLILSNFCTILALFAVTAPRLIYTVQYGETVQMICKFPVEDNVNLNKLKVSWEYINSHQTTSRDLLILNDGNLEMTNQPNLYKGRISLLLEELKKGQAVLEIRNVKLIDSGKYRCVLQLEGSDYKTITLEVQASYKNIYTHTQLSPDGSELLTCLSSGYPEADVYWQTNGINVSFPVNTSYKLTPDGFYNITSTIKYKTDSRQNYSCVFWNKALNERTQGSFGFSEKKIYESAKNVNIKIIISIMCALLVMILSIILYSKRKHVSKCFQEKEPARSTCSENLIVMTDSAPTTPTGM